MVAINKLELVMRHLWNENELVVLKTWFPKVNTICLTGILNRPYAGIAAKASQLGLKKSEAFLISEHSKRFKKGTYNSSRTQFKKGSVPANKGKKVPQEIYEQMSKTFFKKGLQPHNWKPVGSERVSKLGYVEIKTTEGKYKLKHRVVWEIHHGKVPEGYKVSFKDGNKLNLEIENLELISNQDLAKRNSIINYPEEIQQVMRLLGKLNRKINEKQN